MTKTLVKAYTLIELLIVMTIIGMIFGIGYAGFREFSRREAVGSVARDLLSDLRLAREQALSGKKPSGCIGTLNGYSFTLATDGYSVDAVCTNATIPIKEVTVSNVTIESNLSGPLIFKSVAEGTNIPTGTNITFDIFQEANGYSRTLNVSASGEIYEETGQR